MKIKKYILFVAAAAVLGSCSEDYLDQVSPDQMNTENYWRNAGDVESAMAAAYSSLESSNTYWEGFQEGRQVMKQYRNDMIVPGADAYNYPSWTDIYNFTYTFGNPNIFYIWKPSYQGIFYCNQIIEKVAEMGASKIDAEVAKVAIAEAKFLRAYYHFDLLQNFEKIIIRDAVTTEKNLDKELASRSAAYDFIISDLKTAASDLLPQQDDNNKGRATKYTAMAYLGKVYLYRAGEETANATTWFGEAEKALAPIVGDKKYSLVDDYLSMFDGTSSNSSESLFELQMSPNEDNGAYYKFVLYYFYGAPQFGGWDEIQGTSYLISEMKKEGPIAEGGLCDYRLYWNCFFNDPYFNDTLANRVYDTTFMAWFFNENSPEDTNRVFMRKFIPREYSVFENWGYAQNVPLMRYADVLLMYAEALNETGKTSESLPLINEVRKRAKMPTLESLNITSQPAVREQIRHERIMELTLEGQRFFDLRRWGILEQAMSNDGRDGFDAQKHSYLPVPELEVISNSKIN